MISLEVDIGKQWVRIGLIITRPYELELKLFRMDDDIRQQMVIHLLELRFRERERERDKERMGEWERVGFRGVKREGRGSSSAVVVVAAAKEIDTAVTRTDERVRYTASFRIVFHATVGAKEKKQKARGENERNKYSKRVSFSPATTIFMSEDRCVFR